MTTNYDCLLEDAYFQQSSKRAVVLTHQHADAVLLHLGPYGKHRRQAILKIHGSIDEGSIILTKSDYEAFAERLRRAA